MGADGCVVCDEFEGGISQKINKREEKIKFQYFFKIEKRKDVVLGVVVLKRFAVDFGLLQYLVDVCFLFFPFMCFWFACR